jgi:hypothetical protein
MAKSDYRLYYISLSSRREVCFRWTYFHEVLYLKSFRKSLEQVSLKYDNNNGYFTWDFCTVMIIFRWILLRTWNILGEICTKFETLILYLIHFLMKIMPFKRYERNFKNTVQPDRAQMTIRDCTEKMCLARGLPEAGIRTRSGNI